jgi:hypothetical protein
LLVQKDPRKNFTTPPSLIPVLQQEGFEFLIEITGSMFLIL